MYYMALLLSVVEAGVAHVGIPLADTHVRQGGGTGV